ncbi:CD180 antigen [Sardina pilchardus]|uniref:CD180 antigen n=1 Tax=Sardina pilchardus TaxID=27697 RepID=UPI002E1071C3
MGRKLILCVLMFQLVCGQTPPAKYQCLQIVNGYDCSGRNLESVPDIVSNTTQNLDFSFNNLPNLYKSTFGSFSELLSLDLTRCRIDLMFEDAFVAQAKLQTLILTGNPLIFISVEAFSGLKSLAHLIMPQTAIGDLEHLPISKLQLETLDISSSSLHTLEGLAAICMTKMKLLNLARNHIPSISASDLTVFKGAKEDLEVSFRSNDILSMEPGAFRSLRFRSLDFTNCFARVDVSVVLTGLEGVTTETLRLGTFEGERRWDITAVSLRSLCNVTVSHLNLQMQHWAGVSNATFECMGGLKILEMTQLHINNFPDKITTMGKLSELNLDRNALKNVCDISAHSFPSLKSLSMRDMGVYVGKLIFLNSCLQNLSHLEYLDLSCSELKVEGSCCEKHLQGLGHLRLLNLSYNSPMQWDALPFSATPELRHLDCEHVRVNLSTSAPFSNLELLETLNLSMTTISLAHPRLLEGLKSLVRLELSENPVPGGMLSDPNTFKHVPLLESLVLAQCQLTAITGDLFRNLTKLTYADFSANYLTKLGTFFSPAAAINLNFAHNRIELVDIDSIKGLGPNSSVDLSYNPLVCNCSNIEFIDWAKANADKLMHFGDTLCNLTNQRVKPSEVNLVCTNFAGLEAFCIAVLIIVVVAAVVAIVKKAVKKTQRYEQYTQL